MTAKEKEIILAAIDFAEKHGSISNVAEAVFNCISMTIQPENDEVALQKNLTDLWSIVVKDCDCDQCVKLTEDVG